MDNHLSDVTNNDIYMLLKEIKNDNEEIKINIKQIREDLNKQTTKVEKLNKKIDALEIENKELREKFLVTQRVAKKNNIIIFGIPEEEDPKNYFVNILKNKLEIDLEETDINSIYRVGIKSDNKFRPVLLEFVRNTKKQEIFKNIFKFKGSGLSITNDLPQEDREQQKLLYKHYKIAKEKKYQAKIVKHNLIVNGECFTYEQLKDTEIEDSSITKNQNPMCIRGNHSAPSTPSGISESLANTNSSGISYMEAEEPKTEEIIIEKRREISKEITQISGPPSKSTRSNKKPSDTALISPPAKKK